MNYKALNDLNQIVKNIGSGIYCYDPAYGRVEVISEYPMGYTFIKPKPDSKIYEGFQNNLHELGDYILYGEDIFEFFKPPFKISQYKNIECFKGNGNEYISILHRAENENDYDRQLFIFNRINNLTTETKRIKSKFDSFRNIFAPQNISDSEDITDICINILTNKNTITWTSKEGIRIILSKIMLHGFKLNKSHESSVKIYFEKSNVFDLEFINTDDVYLVYIEIDTSNYTITNVYQIINFGGD